VSGIDRNRIDRLPTKGERLVGIALAAVAALVFLALVGLGAVVLIKDPAFDRSYAIGFVSVTGLMSAVCLFLLYRLVFTRPQATSSRTNRVAWTLLATFTTIAFLLCLIWPATRASTPMLGMLAALAISRTIVARNASLKPTKRRG
jgi:hypothetical protein